MIKSIVIISVICGWFYVYISFLDHLARQHVEDPVTDVYGG